jgi:hypothetical protein
VILSLWVDGNFKAWRRKKLEARRSVRAEQDSYQNRFVLPAATVEEEFTAAGFRIQERLDFCRSTRCGAYTFYVRGSD